MSAAGRQKLWAREKEEQAAPKRRIIVKPSGIKEVANWGVVKQYDSGATVVYRDRLTEFVSVRLAGELRDQMTDAECAQGWNYQARRLRGRF